MSTATRRTLADALASAEAFRALFAGCYERWQVAGSIRRKKPDVGDVEHLVIPKHETRTTMNGLFPSESRANLLWERADELVTKGIATKHLYGGTGYRWGDKYRGLEFGGMLHELWTATADNWGNQLTIRTGPADMSQGIVAKFKREGMYRQIDGFLVHVASGEMVPVPDEETYWKLAGVRWTEPEDR